jgi:hypothetical protein
MWWHGNVHGIGYCAANFHGFAKFWKILPQKWEKVLAISCVLTSKIECVRRFVLGFHTTLKVRDHIS